METSHIFVGSLENVRVFGRSNARLIIVRIKTYITKDHWGKDNVSKGNVDKEIVDKGIMDKGNGDNVNGGKGSKKSKAGAENEDRFKKLEDEMKALKAVLEDQSFIPMSAENEDRLKKLEVEMKALRAVKDPSNEDRLKNLEDEIKKLREISFNFNA